MRCAVGGYHFPVVEDDKHVCSKCGAVLGWLDDGDDRDYGLEFRVFIAYVVAAFLLTAAGIYLVYAH